MKTGDASGDMRVMRFRLLAKVCQRLNLLVLGAALALSHLASPAFAVGPGEKSGVIEWSIWIDPDGCMHWWADGGLEGYMVLRRDPHNGRPICLDRTACMIESTDTLFETNSASLAPGARARLEAFFQQEDAVGYSVFGHTDNRSSAGYNRRLSEQRAEAVAAVGQSVGAMIDRRVGLGETRPRATNATAAGRQQNRRVEIICYKWKAP